MKVTGLSIFWQKSCISWAQWCQLISHLSWCFLALVLGIGKPKGHSMIMITFNAQADLTQ